MQLLLCHMQSMVVYTAVETRVSLVQTAIASYRIEQLKFRNMKNNNIIILWMNMDTISFESPYLLGQWLEKLFQGRNGLVRSLRLSRNDSIKYRLTSFWPYEYAHNIRWTCSMVYWTQNNKCIIQYANRYIMNLRCLTAYHFREILLETL